MRPNAMKNALLAAVVALALWAPAASAFWPGSYWDHPLARGALYRPPEPRLYNHHHHHHHQQQHQQQEPCANLAEPLDRADFAVKPAPVKEGDQPAGSVIEATLRGLSSRPSVSLLRPGLIEVAAERPVAPRCRYIGSPAAERVVRRFRVPADLRADDIIHEYDAASGRLAVRVPERPRGPPGHCLNALAPLAKLEPRVEARADGTTEITAHLPGVRAGDARVRLATPGLLELLAVRPVTDDCRRWSAGPDAVRRQWRVSPSLTERQLRAELRDGNLRVVVPADPRAAPKPASAPAAPATASAPQESQQPQQPQQQQQQDQAPQHPQKPARTLEELEALLATVASAVCDGTCAKPAPAAEAAPREDLEDATGAPRWFHIPLEGPGEGAAPAPACEDVPVLDLDLEEQPVAAVTVVAC